MPFSGRQLRTAREQRGLSLNEVADALLINVLYLDALENDLPGEIPPGPYRKLYAIAYYDFLGLAPPVDESPQFIRTAPVEELESAADLAEQARRMRMAGRIALLMIGLIGVSMLFRLCHHG